VRNEGDVVADVTQGQLDELITRHGLAAHAAAIRSLARPCVRVTAERVEQQSELSPRDSRLGGEPHLPQQWPWPWWDTHPLAHLATIRLSEASRHDVTGLLPREGMLYFWYDLFDQPWGYDPKNAGQFRVDYWPDEAAELVLRELSIEKVGGSVDQNNFRYTPRRPCRLGFTGGVTIPNWEWVRTFATPLAPSVEGDAYDDLNSFLCGGDVPSHQLLGHPDHMQGPMEEECQLVTNGIYCGDRRDIPEHQYQALIRGVEDWQLLLQIDTDEEGPGWMWGDCGKLYYWIRRRDLALRDFSKTWTVLQCY
jgi:uncharacterized protein YwqG